MKRTIFLAIIVLVLIAGVVIPVYAHPYGGHGGHGGFHGTIWIGPGWWGPGWWGPGWWGSPYYPYPYYSQPPVVIQQQPVYQQPAPVEEEQTYWYYCPDANAYYPYVKNCPKGWLRVVPTQPK